MNTSSVKNILKIKFLRKRLRKFLKPSPQTIYSDKIASHAHNSIELFAQGYPLPPIRLRDMVRRGALLPEDFLIEGRQAFEAIIQAANEAGAPVRKDSNILEFGVGCGRIARHFLAEKYSRFTGTDVDNELIAWSQSRLQTAETVKFLKNNFLPPIALPGSSFDFVYSISVFTHMDREAQKLWANEMGRLVSPGGVLCVSFLEEDNDSLPSGTRVKTRVDPEYTRTWFGKDGAPKTYYNSYNTREAMEDLFSENFTVAHYKPKAIRKRQTVIVFIRNIDKLDDKKVLI